MTDTPEPPRLVWRSTLARRRHERAEVRRFTKRRRDRRRGWIIAISSVGLLIAFIAVAVFTPLMSVRTIEVYGTSRLDTAEVTSVLQSLEGQPLAQVTNTDVEQLLEQFVLVQSYTVQRTPPSTLVVRIVEREPIGLYQLDGTNSVVDAAGVVLWRVDGDDDPGDTPKLPVLDAGALGSKSFLAAGRVALALTTEFRAQVTTITATTPEDVTLLLDDGTTVIWGSVDESERKSIVLQSLREATGGAGISTYDVSSPEKPVTR